MRRGCLFVLCLLLSVSGQAQAQTTTAGPGLGLLIPDGLDENNTPGAALVSVLEVDGQLSIENVEVSVAADHPWVGDLEMSLTSPDGVTVTLLDRPRHPSVDQGDSSDLSSTFPLLFSDTAMEAAEQAGSGCGGGEPIGESCSSELRPEQVLDTFVGKDAGGQWVLSIRDHAKGLTGTLDSWTLRLMGGTSPESPAGEPIDSEGVDSEESDSGADHDGGPDEAPTIEARTLSGSWIDLGRSGEGVMLEILSDGVTAVVYWLTYDPGGAQISIVGVGTLDDDSIVVKEAFVASGGVFGVMFDPALIVRELWGSLELSVASCEQLQMTYSGPAGFGEGTLQLSRLASVAGLGCGGASVQPGESANGLSGSFYDPAHSGEGFIFQVLEGGRLLLYWLTFDFEGNAVWIVGVGDLVGGRAQIDTAQFTEGASFGESFDPGDVVRLPWGSISVSYSACDRALLEYESSAGFGSGSQNLQRISTLLGTTCSEP